MVFLKSFLDALVLSFLLFFGGLLASGFQGFSFILPEFFSELGFLILVGMLFLELVGIRG